MAIHHPIIKTAKFVKGSNQSIQMVANGNRKIVVQTEDGLNQVASYHLAQDSAKATLVLVHGIRASKEDWNSLIPELQKRGFNILAIDLRAHGESEGTYCTFGAKEKGDIKHFVDSLDQELPIGIWGRSLGGAVALQTLAIDQRIDFGIIESTFCSFEQITKDYFERYAGFRLDGLMNFAIWRAGKMANFDPEEAMPLKSSAQISQAVFMAHGSEDQFILPEYGKSNFDALKSEVKQLEIVEGGGHANLWSVGGENYFQSVWSFIDTQLE